MPELSGLDVCKAMRHKPELRSVPVIMLTSETDVGAEGLALAAGAADFIRKPVNPEVLLSRVRNSLSREKAATV